MLTAPRFMSSISAGTPASSPCRCSDGRARSIVVPMLPSSALSLPTTIWVATSSLPVTTSDSPRWRASASATRSISAACGAVWASPPRSARPGSSSSWFTRRATAASSATATAPSSDGATASRRSALLPVTESPASHWTWNPRVPSAVRRRAHCRANSTGASQVPRKSASSATTTRARSNRKCGTTAAPKASRFASRSAASDIGSWTTCRKPGKRARKSASTARVDGLLIVGDSSTIARRSRRRRRASS